MTGIIGLLTKFGAILQVGKVLWNAPKIFRFFNKFSGVGKELLRTKRLPSNHESADFLKATAELIRAKIVDFPGVDEDEVAKVIEELALEIEVKTAA